MGGLAALTSAAPAATPAKPATDHGAADAGGFGLKASELPAGAAVAYHAIAAEWAYVVAGRCQTVVLDPSGQTEVNNYLPGDLWFFPKGHGHAIQTIGNEPCQSIVVV